MRSESDMDFEEKFHPSVDATDAIAQLAAGPPQSGLSVFCSTLRHGRPYTPTTVRSRLPERFLIIASS